MMVICPVCLSSDGFDLIHQPSEMDFRVYLECAVCGMFGVDRDLIDNYLEQNDKKVTRRVRAILSHWINLNQKKSKDTLLLTDETFYEALEGKLTLPNPAQLALRIIQFIGDHVQSTGEKLESLPKAFSAKIGATSREATVNLIGQLGERGLLQFIDTTTHDCFDAMNVDLTLAGWETYQAERAGEKTAGFGFLAMKFGDEDLENLAQNHLKPSIKSLGFDLVDMRDVAAPGIIDNIMRMRIRDANFVIVDLTHDNSGAYWEAGYAEGLGKPVLYICEEGKFAERQTHFDTNHCTTVMWKSSEPDDFCSRIVATLRRALP